MKKLLLSTAISAVMATAASAATVYEKDELSFNIDGDYQIQLIQAIGTDQDLDVEYDDLELKFGVEYNLNNGVTAFGQLDLESNDGDTGADEAYVGLKVGGLTASLGAQLWGSDDFGIEKAVEFDGDNAGDNAFPSTEGDDTIKFSYDLGQYKATLSHDIEDSDVDDSATDLLITSNFGSISAGFVYQDYSADAASDSIDTLGLMASLDIGKANVGVDYSTNDFVDSINLAADYSFGQTTVAAGVNLKELDGDDDQTHWYLNGNYELHSNVNLFAEIGDNDIDDSDLGFLTGMQVKF